MRKRTLAVCLGCALSPALMARNERPNVILILADDLGYGDISAFNPDSKIHTPNIDKLARNGITFTDAHAGSALSTPSRYSLLTGRYPWRTTLKKAGLDGDSPAMISPERPTIARMFSKCGYTTACVGKWHLGWDWTYKGDGRKMEDIDFAAPIKNGPTDRGFDYYFGIPASLDISPYVYVENDMATSVPDHKIEKQNKDLTLLMHGGLAGADFEPEECFPNLIRHGLDFIDGQKGSDKPFFLYMPITAPHTPVLPSREFQGKTEIGPYGDFVVMIDDMVRQFVKALKKNKQLDDTILIFASDNGCAAYIGVEKMEEKGHYPSSIYKGYKSDIYDGGHRVPLIVSWKGRIKEETNASVVSLMDFYATFAQMLGYDLASDEAVDSYSMWPVWCQDGGTTSRKDLVHEAGEGYLALRDQKMKLVFYGGSGGWTYPQKAADVAKFPPMQLFDMEKDPGERVNLIDDPSYAGKVEEMKNTMKGYIENGRSTPGEKLDNDTPNVWNQVRIIME